ncbi:MAG: hypothetical protein IJH12_09515 [Clostridia bacterium]|nr:hypothetical protein [Clostridia bacterium]
MRKVLRIIVILIIVVILVVDFYGLWKFKINGNKYVIETSEEDDSAVEENLGEEAEEYEELTSETLADGKVLFIKSIEEADEGYTIKGVVYEAYEILKDDYTSLKSGESIEILGSTYTKSQIKSNNLILKSSDSSATAYYINYDTTNKKYILKEKETDYIVYKSTKSSVKIDVPEGTTFATIKNGKTSTKKVEDVLDSHKKLEEPEAETGSINTCTLTFNKNGDCTKITETIR